MFKTMMHKVILLLVYQRHMTAETFCQKFSQYCRGQFFLISHQYFFLSFIVNTVSVKNIFGKVFEAINKLILIFCGSNVLNFCSKRNNKRNRIFVMRITLKKKLLSDLCKVLIYQVFGTRKLLL